MKITDVNQQIKPESKIQVENNRDSRKQTSEAAATAVGTDTVELSATSREVQKIQSMLAQTPEVRTELIQSLKGQIERGEYQVDSRQVAEKMILDFLNEDMIS